jgi:hypothetical protein
MRALALLVLLAACGGGGSSSPPAAPALDVAGCYSPCTLGVNAGFPFVAEIEPTGDSGPLVVVAGTLRFTPAFEAGFGVSPVFALEGFVTPDALVLTLTNESAWEIDLHLSVVIHVPGGALLLAGTADVFTGFARYPGAAVTMIRLQGPAGTCADWG